MRFRLMISLPLSLAIVGLLLVSASTLFAAVEDAQGTPSVAATRRSEHGSAGSAAAASSGSAEGRAPSESAAARCDRWRREIHALSHEVTPCALAPECHGSPLLCPIALDPGMEREYARLRTVLQTECGIAPDLLDFAWSAGSEVDLGERCEVVHDGWEAAARGSRAPSTYTF